MVLVAAAVALVAWRRGGGAGWQAGSLAVVLLPSLTGLSATPASVVDNSRQL